MSNVRHLGRFTVTDGRNTGRVGDTAAKMELARFPGHHVVAEREGEDLVIYQLGDSDGLGVLMSGNTVDRSPKTVADLQRVYDSAYGRRQTPRQKLDQHSAGQCLADRVRGQVR